MTLEKFVSSVMTQINEAKDYKQVDSIITVSINSLKEKKYILEEYVDLLEMEIEKLSPITLNSTQFSCFRYAAISLRNYSVFQRK